MSENDNRYSRCLKSLEDALAAKGIELREVDSLQPVHDRNTVKFEGTYAKVSVYVPFDDSDSPELSDA